jgi:hypothetical protein
VVVAGPSRALILCCGSLALPACVSEPLDPADPQAAESDRDVAYEGDENLPTAREQLAAVIAYCERLGNICPDFSVVLCTDVQAALLPEASHPCHAAVVRRTMCLGVPDEHLECTSRFSAAPEAGYCEAERARATACYGGP